MRPKIREGDAVYLRCGKLLIVEICFQKPENDLERLDIKYQALNGIRFMFLRTTLIYLKK